MLFFVSYNCTQNSGAHTHEQHLGAGELMDNIGGHVNPLHLVRQLPAGMEIPGLRDRLVGNCHVIC